MRGRLPVLAPTGCDAGFAELRFSEDTGALELLLPVLPSDFFSGFPSGFCLTAFKIGLQSYAFIAKNGHLSAALLLNFQSAFISTPEMLLLPQSQQATL